MHHIGAIRGANSSLPMHHYAAFDVIWSLWIALSAGK